MLGRVCRPLNFMTIFYDPVDILEPAKLSGKFTLFAGTLGTFADFRASG